MSQRTSKDIGNIASCRNINETMNLGALPIARKLVKYTWFTWYWVEVNVWDRHWGENGGFSECADRMIFDLSIVASGVADQKLASSIMEVLKGHWEVLRVDSKGTCAPAERVIGTHVHRPKWSISENSWISDRFASPFLFIPFPFLYPFLMFSPLLFWYVLVCFGQVWGFLGVPRFIEVGAVESQGLALCRSEMDFFAKCHATSSYVQILVVVWIYSVLVFMRCDYI